MSFCKQVNETYYVDASSSCYQYSDIQKDDVLMRINRF